MIGAVHATIGAAIGALCKRKSSAFVAGVISHVVADALPHHDFPPKVEVPLVAATVLLIGKFKGFDSPEFWGALGAIAPDSEHGLALALGTGFDHELFPTHMAGAKFHGCNSNERLSQLIMAAASAFCLALSGSEKK
jgi:hypothetical protein